MNVNSFARREFIAPLGLSAAAAQLWTWTAGAAPSLTAATRPARLGIDPKLAG